MAKTIGLLTAGGDSPGPGNSTLLLSQQPEQLTGLESRVTILDHLPRGGTPSAADRLLQSAKDTGVRLGD